jgi:multidrug efflux system membrane fusion protein
VHAADTNGIVLLTQIRPITVVFTLPQRDLPIVSAALARGKAAVQVLDSNRGVLASGTLQTVDNQIDVTTGTIKLKALFANDDDKLWPGQFVSARVVVDTFVDAKVVAAAAIRRGPNGTFVYAVDSESRAVVRPVEVLLEDEARAVIGRGIDSTATVVTVGFAQLTDHRLVQIVAGEPSAKAGAPPAPEAAVSDNEGQRAQGSEERKRRRKEGEHSPQRRKGDTREAQQ